MRHAPLVLVALVLFASAAAAQDVWVEPVTGMEFVHVPGGCFMMGCGEWMSDCYDHEQPANRVCVDGFWLARHETTQAQWEAVMDHNPSAFRGPDRPVERVEWHDAQAFLDALNARTGLSLRLPTEAEWEYAARSGGKQERYAGGHALDEAAWHRGNAGGTTHPVGQKAPNGLGLHDMSGNVWEWCDDAERRYYTPAEKNPRGTGSGKVFRGGSHTNAPDFVRTTHRIYIQPDIAYDNLGFRVLRPE